MKDRLSEDLEENTCIHVMSLPESGVWIRYSGRVIAGVKANFKNSHTNDLSCRCCHNEARDDPAYAQDSSDRTDLMKARNTSKCAQAWNLNV